MDRVLVALKSNAHLSYVKLLRERYSYYAALYIKKVFLMCRQLKSSLCESNWSHSLACTAYVADTAHLRCLSPVLVVKENHKKSRAANDSTGTGV